MEHHEVAKPLVIRVAGGTGSGKTTVVQKIVQALDSRDVVVLEHDSYYRDRSHLPPGERTGINYDHPDALKTDLLVRHLEQLIAGLPVEIPVYDFATRTRQAETARVEPTDVVIVEGILIFVDSDLRSLMDIKIFVDTDDDVRFIRCMERDIQERGRSRESAVEQCLTTVKPMHLEFVEPSEQTADVIIPEGGHNVIAVDLVATRVSTLLK